MHPWTPPLSNASELWRCGLILSKNIKWYCTIKKQKKKKKTLSISIKKSVQTFLAIFSEKAIFTYTFTRVISLACHTATTVMAWGGKTWRLPKEEAQHLHIPHSSIE